MGKTLHYVGNTIVLLCREHSSLRGVIFLIILLCVTCGKSQNSLTSKVLKFEPPAGNYPLKDIEHIKIYSDAEVESIYWTADEKNLPIPGSENTRKSGNPVTITVSDIVNSDGSLTISAFAVLKNGSKTDVLTQKYKIILPPKIILEPKPGIFYSPQYLKIYCAENCKLKIDVKEEGEGRDSIKYLFDNSATLNIVNTSEISVTAEDSVSQISTLTAKYVIQNKLSLSVYGCNKKDDRTFSCVFPSTVSISSQVGVKIYISEDAISFNLVGNPYYIFLSEPKAYFVYLQLEDVRSDVMPIGFISNQPDSSFATLTPGEGNYKEEVNITVYNFPEEITSQIFIGDSYYATCPPTCSIQLKEGRYLITARTQYGYEKSANYVISSEGAKARLFPASGEYEEPLTVYVDSNEKVSTTVCNTTKCSFKEYQNSGTIPLSRGQWIVYAYPSTDRSQIISRNYTVYKKTVLEFPRDATLYSDSYKISLLPQSGFVSDYYLTPITTINIPSISNLKAVEEGGKNIHICAENGYFEIVPSTYSIEYSLPGCDGIAMTTFGIPAIAVGNSVFVPNDRFFSFSLSEDVVALSPIGTIGGDVLFQFGVWTKNYYCLLTHIGPLCYQLSAMPELSDIKSSIGAFGTSLFLKGKNEIVKYSIHPFAQAGIISKTKTYKGDKAFIFSEYLFITGKTEDGFYFLDTIKFFDGNETFEDRRVFSEEIVGVEKAGNQTFVCTKNKVFLVDTHQVGIYSAPSILGCASVGGKLFVVEPTFVSVLDIKGEKQPWTPVEIDIPLIIPTLHYLPKFYGYSFVGVTPNKVYICNESNCKIIDSITSSAGDSPLGKIINNGVIPQDTLLPFNINIFNPEGNPEIKDIRLLPGGFLVEEAKYQDRTTIIFVNNSSSPPTTFSIPGFENFEYFLNNSVFQYSNTAIFVTSKSIQDEITLGDALSNHSIIGSKLVLDSAIEDLSAQQGYILAKHPQGFYALTPSNFKKFISSSLTYLQQGIGVVSDGKNVKVLFVDTDEVIWEGQSSSSGLAWASFSFPYVFAGFPDGIQIAKLLSGLQIPEPEREGEIIFQIQDKGFTKISLCNECKNCTLYTSNDGGNTFSEFNQGNYLDNPLLKIRVKGGDILKCIIVKQW